MQNNNSNSNINNITLECLMNSTRYNKYKSSMINTKNQEFNDDKKFYRKRIISLTKELFSCDVNNGVNNGVNNESLKTIFNNYVKQLIIYFKDIDRQDIIQNHYTNDDLFTTANNKNEINYENKIDDICKNELNNIDDINDVNNDISNVNKYANNDISNVNKYANNDISNINNINTSSINNLLLREKCLKDLTLDNYVKITNTNIINKQIIPLKREINLKDPILKKKGLKNKISDNKNIDR
jgi:hypothetical protein